MLQSLVEFFILSTFSLFVLTGHLIVTKCKVERANTLFNKMRGVEFLCCTPFNFLLYHHNLFNCRSSSSDYIIPFGKFSKSLGSPLSIGMRFKMRYESEDSAERRLGSNFV